MVRQEAYEKGAHDGQDGSRKEHLDHHRVRPGLIQSRTGQPGQVDRSLCPARRAGSWRRVTPWERDVAIAVFAGMIALGAALFEGHAGLATQVLVWSVLCLMSTEFIAPAIDEIVFPR